MYTNRSAFPRKLGLVATASAVAQTSNEAYLYTGLGGLMRSFVTAHTQAATPLPNSSGVSSDPQPWCRTVQWGPFASTAATSSEGSVAT